MGTTQGQGANAQHSIAERIDRLPMLPSTVVELIGLDPSSDDYPTQVQEVVERDPSLAARVLSWANSATSGPREPIQSLPQAIMRMGARRAAQLITSVAVMRVFVPGTEEVRNLWRHALQTATAARELAQAAGPGLDPHQAYVFGLMHDIGRFVIFGSLPESMRKSESHGWGEDPLAAAERGQLGYDHTVIGWYACTSWGFPNDMAALVQAHHEDEPSAQQLPQNLLPLLRVVQQADHLSSLLLERPQIADEAPEIRRRALQEACVCPGWTRPPVEVEQIEAQLGTIVTASAASLRLLGLQGG